MTRQPRCSEVRRSPVHGMGAFALRRIRKGTRIVEYLGERVSHEEADRRYETKDATDAHTFLFIVDSKTVIDAGVDGNDARFLNHSCKPNCQSVIERRRVFIEATRHPARRGDDLRLSRSSARTTIRGTEEVFACRCGLPGVPRHHALAGGSPQSAPKRRRKATQRARPERDARKRRRDTGRARGTARKSSRRR